MFTLNHFGHSSWPWNIVFNILSSLIISSAFIYANLSICINVNPYWVAAIPKLFSVNLYFWKVCINAFTPELFHRNESFPSTYHYTVEEERGNERKAWIDLLNSICTWALFESRVIIRMQHKITILSINAIASRNTHFIINSLRLFLSRSPIFVLV